jgi:hypothetical protein
MSHMARVQVEVSDLDALEDAAKALGLEMVRNVSTYKWYGKFMRDWPLPQGITEKDLGKCEHVLRIPGDSTSYEVGVARSKTDPSKYVLLFDFWAGGGNLVKHVGKDGYKLMMQYPCEVARKHLRQRGRRVIEERTPEGKIVLRGRRG